MDLELTYLFMCSKADDLGHFTWTLPRDEAYLMRLQHQTMQLDRYMRAGYVKAYKILVGVGLPDIVVTVVLETA